MSKIEDLIKQYCPNGVEYKELGDVCLFKKGQSITSKHITKGKIPVIAGGKTPAYYHNEANRYGETIAISSSGAYAGFVSYWSIPVFLSDSFSVEPDINLKVKYVYYFLSNLQEYIYSLKSTGGIPHIYAKNIIRLKIPVPPLPVQEEIVRILDAFSSLEAELEAELEARKKQYEHYRNKLLTFNENSTGGGKIKFMKLGEVCDIYTGGELPKDCIKGSLSDDTHLYPVYGNGKDIYGYSSTYRIDKDAVCISSIGANTGAVFFYKKNFTPIIRLKVLVPKSNDLKTRYLYHIATTLMFVSKNNGGIPNMNANDVRRHVIPIPPLDEQERIVAILDKFDTLVNDISEGLPAELNARRQQYEYYRNKLLTFDEAA